MAVWEDRVDSVATRRPLGKVVILVSGEDRMWVWEVRVGLGEPYLTKRGSEFSRFWSFDLTERAKRS